MSTRRGALAALVLLGPALFPGTAAAQDEPPPVHLTLARQTPWNSPEEPVLEIAVRAENLGAAPIEDLSLGIVIGTAVRTRNAYEESLRSGPSFQVFADTRQLGGSLAPGEVRTFEASVDLSAVALSRTESLIYPVRVDLRAGGEPTGAELRSPMLFIVRQPEQPLAFTWAFELARPPAFGPDGALADPSLVDAVGDGGVLREQARALRILVAGRHPSAVNLVVMPRLLEELARMAAGFTGPAGEVPTGEGAAADAAALLSDVREAASAAATELTALPYADPSVAALLSSGLDEDLGAQELLGRTVVAEILGAEPGPVARPAGGDLDQATLDRFAAAPVVLGDAGALDVPPDPLGLALPPTGAALASVGTPVPVVLPDLGVQGLLSSELAQTDPVLTAQAALGELAAIWQEAPGTPGRGAAVSTADVSLPAGFWQPFARRVAGAPFLRLVPATELVEAVPPTRPLALASRSSAVFSRSYTQSIKEERRRLEAFSSMLVQESDEPERLARTIFAAESAAFLQDESPGRALLAAVHAITEEAFAATVPRAPQVFTLTSTSGTIPILLGDPGERDLRVVVELNSSQLRFPSGDRREIVLERAEQVVAFDVQAASTGQITVEVLVRAPSGRVVGETRLLVRSTAYSRIALIITGAAALGLVALWARRFLRRRTS